MERKKTGKSPAAGGNVSVLERPQERELDLSQKVRETAYSLFEKRGYAHGKDLQDWFEAEKMVYKNKG